MYSVNDRLVELRKVLSLSQEEFGKELGLSRSVIKNIEYHITAPKPAFLDLVIKTYNVNRVWLETGEGEMFETMSPDLELSYELGKIMGGDPEDSFRKRFIAALVQLDPDDWKVIESFCHKIVDARQNENKKEDE